MHGEYFRDIRLGNESVPADNITLKRLVLQGTNRSYGSLISEYNFENMAFTKLRSVYKYNTGKKFVKRNTKKAWRKTGHGRIEMPDYPDDAILEGIVHAAMIV